MGSLNLANLITQATTDFLLAPTAVKLSELFYFSQRTALDEIRESLDYFVCLSSVAKRCLDYTTSLQAEHVCLFQHVFFASDTVLRLANSHLYKFRTLYLPHAYVASSLVVEGATSGFYLVVDVAVSMLGRFRLVIYQFMPFFSLL